MNLRTFLLHGKSVAVFVIVAVGLLLCTNQRVSSQIAASCMPNCYNTGAGYVYYMYIPSITINGTTYSFCSTVCNPDWGPGVAGTGQANTNVTVQSLPGATVSIGAMPYLNYVYNGAYQGQYGGYWCAYVDYNNNGTWEANETVVSQYYSQSAASFVIPSTVSPGPKRLRFVKCYSTTAYNGACNTTYYYKDFKDFTLNIGFNNDANLTGISTSTAVPFAPGLNDINVNVTNNGLNTISGMTLNYTLTPSSGSPITGTYNYTGTIAGGASATIPIYPSYIFSPVGSVNVSVTVGTVNGVSDGNSANNSANALLGAGLNGTYTIGGSSPDFTSVSQACGQLTAGGTIGPVTFNIRPGTYTENSYIANIPGNNSTKPIVFQSENGNKNSVILQFSFTPAAAITGTTSIGGVPTLRLNNADYIAFKNFTIGALNTAASSGVGIELIGLSGGASGCDNITFDNMVFNGVATTGGTLGDAFFISTNSGYHPNLVVSNCTFNQSAIAFYHVRTVTPHTTGVQLINNTFTNFGAYGSRLEGTDGATVNGNSWTSTSTTLLAGVVFFNHNGAFNFRKNRLNLTINNGISTVTSSTRTATSQAVFANNFIKVNGSSGVGINATGTTNVGIFHNTIYDATGGSAFTATSGSSLSVVNNIFINAGSGPAVTGGSGVTFNYNNYFVSGPTFGIWSGSAQASFASWKSVSAQDAASSNVAVVLANPAINDLSLTIVDPALYGIGSTSNGTVNQGIKGTVGDDIFGNSRLRTEVFMGAHQLIPVISFNPAPPTTLSGCANQTLTLSANAQVTFGAALTFSWQRNGAPLLDGVNGVSGANSNTLTITGAQPSLNGGDYVLRITATGGADPLVSNIISVTVNAPIVIDVQPASRVICLGNETSMAVVASGTILGYQWQKDGQNIAGATGPIYVVSNAGYTVSGRYRCVMSGTCGTTTITSDDAVVYVASSTLIGRDPVVTGAAVGSTGYLTVEVNATAQIPGYSPQFQWYMGTTMLADDGRITGTTTSQLTVRNMQAADIAANYYCVVTGICGSQTSKQGGFYISQISIQTQPQSQEACGGMDATMNVSVSSNIPGVQYSYQWKKNGNPISNNATYQGATTSVLTIAKAGASEAADYTVLVTANPTGATITSATATVSVISAPVIGTQPQSMTVCAGDPVHMSVVATGGTLSYQWKIGAANFPNGTASTADLASADGSMNGAKITCIVSNNCGNTTTQEAVLTVNEKPVITVGPANAAVSAGGNITLSVTATGALSYVWKKDGTAIPGATAASYVITGFTSTQAGNYTVEVTNNCGMVASSAALLTLSGREEEAEAAGYRLSAAVPTPMSETAYIAFTLPSSGNARITLSDVFGREVAVLFDAATSEGLHTVTVDATRLVSGVYNYTLTNGKYTLTKTVVVAR